MLKHILLLGGTKEGRKLAEFLATTSIKITISVATSYGEELLPKTENISVSCKRLDLTAMRQLIKEISADLIIDATHPYALIVSEIAQKACELEKRPLIRIERELTSEKEFSASMVSSISEAVKFLQHTEGNILITTGSKNLSDYTNLPGFTDRVYARVLPSIDAISCCHNLGLIGSHILAMQGPFSVEMNMAMIHHIHAAFLVTKNSGSTGGFLEKLTAAENCGIHSIVIHAPLETSKAERNRLMAFKESKEKITKNTLVNAIVHTAFSKLYGSVEDTIFALSDYLS